MDDHNDEERNEARLIGYRQGVKMLYRVGLKKAHALGIYPRQIELLSAETPRLLSPTARPILTQP